jgi:putative transposase
MPRRPRLILPGIPLHLVQRGNNRSACFYADEDYRRYLDHLQELSIRFGCAIHAYALMSNHVHMLVSGQTQDSLSQLMKHLGQRYVQYSNRTYKRSGTLWEGRYRSCLLQDQGYLLRCHRYIEMNPVRAGMTEHPADYRWSSYRINAQGETSSLIVPHEQYLALGQTLEDRQSAYRDLFNTDLDPHLVQQIREATNGGYVLGDSRFQGEIAQMLGRRVEKGKAGRPRTRQAQQVKGVMV